MVKAKGMAKHAAKVPEYAVLNLRKLPVEIKESLRDEAARLGTTMDALCALYLAEGLERAKRRRTPSGLGADGPKISNTRDGAVLGFGAAVDRGTTEEIVAAAMGDPGLRGLPEGATCNAEEGAPGDVTMRISFGAEDAALNPEAAERVRIADAHRQRAAWDNDTLKQYDEILATCGLRAAKEFQRGVEAGSKLRRSGRSPLKFPQWSPEKMRAMAEAEPGGLMACSPEILTELIEAAKTDETIALKLEHAGLVRDPSGAIFVPTPSGPGAHDDREWAATLAQGRAAVGPDPEDEDFEQPKGILSAHLRDEPKTFTGGAMQPAVIYGDPSDGSTNPPGSGCNAVDPLTKALGLPPFGTHLVEEVSEEGWYKNIRNLPSVTITREVSLEDARKIAAQVREASESGSPRHYAGGTGPHLLRDRKGNTAYCGGPGQCEFCEKSVPESGDHQAVDVESIWMEFIHEGVPVQPVGATVDLPFNPYDCPDCCAEMRHAYSDATTPGFFYDRCEKHRRNDAEGTRVHVTEESEAATDRPRGEEAE